MHTHGKIKIIVKLTVIRLQSNLDPYNPLPQSYPGACNISHILHITSYISTAQLVEQFLRASSRVKMFTP